MDCTTGKFYPYSALITGLAYFVLGSSYWGHAVHHRAGVLRASVCDVPRSALATLEYGGAWAIALTLNRAALAAIGGGSAARRSDRRSIFSGLRRIVAAVQKRQTARANAGEKPPRPFPSKLTITKCLPSGSIATPRLCAVVVANAIEAKLSGEVRCFTGSKDGVVCVAVVARLQADRVWLPGRHPDRTCRAGLGNREWQGSVTVGRAHRLRQLCGRGRRTESES